MTTEGKPETVPDGNAPRGRLKPWMIVSAIWLWPALFGVVNDVGQRRLRGDPPASPGVLIWQAGDWLLYAIVTPFIFAIARRWPIVRPGVRRALGIHLAFALLFCVLWAVGGKLLQLVLMLVLRPGEVRSAIDAAGGELGRLVSVDVTSWILTTLPFGVVVYTTVAGVAMAVTWFLEARAREVQVARLAGQLSTARFAALQAQLNPHFLFNTLNTITVRVRDGDRGGAVRIIELLSEVLRRTLNRHRSVEVTLGEELELVRQYLAIEEARFPDRLSAELVVPDELRNAAVPGFAIQHLVENAIRHGLARRPEAGLVQVAARRDGGSLVVTVRDDGPGMGGAALRPGHGLENTRERIRALHGEAASLIVADAPGGGSMATLRVPFRELPVDTVREEPGGTP